MVLVVLLGNKYTKKSVRANGKIDESAVKPLCDDMMVGYLVGMVYFLYITVYSSEVGYPGSIQLTAYIQHCGFSLGVKKSFTCK